MAQQVLCIVLAACIARLGAQHATALPGSDLLQLLDIKITPEAISNDDLDFGLSVSISGSVLAVGAPQSLANNQRSGLVIIYQEGGLPVTLDSGGFDSEFGRKVVLDGATLAVLGKDVYLYRRELSGWVLEQVISSASFIRSCDARGGMLAVGSKNKADVYRRDPVKETWQLEATLAGTGSGQSVSIGSDEAEVLVGGDGFALVWTRIRGLWMQTAILEPGFSLVGTIPDAGFGDQVLLGPGYALVAAPSFGNHGAGAVFVYKRDGIGSRSWELNQVLKPRPGVVGDAFGQSMAMSSRTILVGASSSVGSAPAAGTIYEFARTQQGRWQIASLSIASDAEPSSYLGAALSFSDGVLATGAPGVFPEGAVYLQAINN